MKEVNIISKVVGRDGASKNISPGAMKVPSVDLSGYLPIKDWNEVFSVRTDANGVPYLFGKLPFVTQYGITMYADGGEVDLPSLYSGIPIDGDTIYWENGILKAKESEVISLEGYATEEWVNARIGSIINGAPAAYDTLKEIADVLQGNINSIGDIINVLGAKWTQDDAKIANWDAAYSWGDHSKVGYALKSYVDDTFVTLATNQPITGEKNFTGGLKVNGSPIVYDATNKYWKLEGDLLITGGVTMYASDSAFTPSTIMDGVVVDGVTIGKRASDGALYFMGETGGGLTEVYWDDIKLKPTFASVAISGKYSDLSGTPTLLSSFIDDFVQYNYLPLSGGQMTGGIGYTLTPDSYGIGLPAAGSTTYSNGWHAFVQGNKSLIGSIMDTRDGAWWNIISVRHYNGATSDGSKYGMYIASRQMLAYTNLVWDSQANGTWQGERVILDSHNWSQYVTAGDGGNYLPLSGGEINGSLQISNGSLALLGAKNSGASTISFEPNGNSYSAITVSRYGIDYNGVLSILPKGGMVGVGLTNPEYKFHVQGDIYSSGMAIANSGIEARGTSSYGTLPYIRLHIPGLTYAQFLINGNGVVELRYGDNTQTGRFMSFSSGDILSSGGITMYSDIRKKTKLQDVELSLSQIANAPLIEHYYNSDTNKTTHVGSIAQYWASMNDWFCKLDNDGYYTMEIQNAALASAISIARELVKYESKTDKEIRMLKDEVKRLKKEIKILKSA